MIFKRYSSPFLFLDKLLENKKFSKGIDTIYKQVEEEKLWALYLSNPFKEKSYIDWKDEIISSNAEFKNEEVDLEAAKNNAYSILKNFKPE